MKDLAIEVLAAVTVATRDDGPSLCEARSALDHGEYEIAILDAIGEAIDFSIPVSVALLERIRSSVDDDSPVRDYLDDIQAVPVHQAA